MLKTTPSYAIVGKLEGLVDGIAVGWVWSPDRPQDIFVVELLVDGYCVAVDRANIFRADLRDQLSEPDRGFQIAVPHAALENGREITVRVANVHAIVPGQIDLRDKATPGDVTLPTTNGEITQSHALTVRGWVMPRQYRDRPVTIQAHLDGTMIAETEASDAPPSQGNTNQPPHLKLFTLRLPFALADGATHQIEITDADGCVLKGSPITVVAHQKGSSSLLEDAAEAATDNPALQKELTLLAQANRRQERRGPASASFDDYELWQDVYPLPFAPQPTGPVHIVIFGPGDDGPTRNALACFGDRVSVTRTQDGILSRNDWPDRGIILFLRAGDTIRPEACAAMEAALQDAEIAYCDSDVRVDDVWRPWFKPDWDRDLYLAQGYVWGLVGMRADVVDQSAAESFLLDDITFNLCASGMRVAHIPHVLHRDEVNTQAGVAALPDGWLADSVAFYLSHTAPETTVTPRSGMPWLNRITWAPPKEWPRVSVIIPTRDRVDLLRTCITGLLTGTDYPDLEIIIVNNASQLGETAAYLDELATQNGIMVLDMPGAFNFSALNNAAAKEATGDVLCLLNNDIEVLEAGWLKEMVSLLLRPDTGAVGAKLLWENDMVQHGGVILGVDGGAVHVGSNCHRDDPGYMGRNQVAHRLSAVTAACMVVHKSDYIALDGLHERNFPVAFNDVDFCMRLRELGRAIVWTPDACLRHHESASRGDDQTPEKAARARRELDKLRELWGHKMMLDPYYNPNLNLDRDPFAGLAMPPRKERSA